AGWIYRTTSAGVNWQAIAQPADTDSTYAQALAFGAPNPNDPPGSLDNFIYAGTLGGNVFVTFTGGGVGTPWKRISGGLDGSALQAIVPDTHRGSHAVYAVTLHNVYFMADSSAANPTWTRITGNLFSANLTRPLFNNPGEPDATLEYLTSLAADWRFAIPDNPAQPVGPTNPTHPVLYAGG